MNKKYAVCSKQLAEWCTAYCNLTTANFKK